MGPKAALILLGILGGTLAASLLLASLLLAPRPAEAAPFCLARPDGSRDCVYHDAAECRKLADKGHARCVVNSQEIRLPANPSPYCVVTTYRSVSCWYFDLQSCRRDAVQNGGTCIDTKQ